MFVDEMEIVVRSGRGGAGCVSFRREKYIPRGGPDGGDGGRGGDVVLEASPSALTLGDLTRGGIFAARRGSPGGGGNRRGKSASHLVISVPEGTLVYDRDTGELLADLSGPGARAVVARGGAGGKGNRAFATATHRAPRESQPGAKGAEHRLRLELKFIADIGLIGLPNAGKSTLLTKITGAHPNVAAYPFTTKSPVLGVVEREDWRRIVVADIPGVVQGASEGVGLGHRFLRHVERAGSLLHLVDASPTAPPSPGEAYRVVREELARYASPLAAKPEILAATKMDLPGAEEGLEDLRQTSGKEVWPVSALGGAGLADLVTRLFGLVEEGQGSTQGPR